MTRYRKIIIGFGAVCGLAVVALVAMPSGPFGSGHAGGALIAEALAGDGHGHGMRRLCGDSRSEKIARAIGRVESRLTFTAEQEAAWSGVVAAVGDSERVVDEHCASRGEAGRSANAPEKLARMQMALTAAGEVVAIMRPAFDAFYETLDAEQRGTIDEMVMRRCKSDRDRHHDDDDYDDYDDYDDRDD